MSDLPIRTRRFEASRFNLGPDCVYLYAATGEDRTRIGERFDRSLKMVVDSRFEASFKYEGQTINLNLRDAAQIEGVLSRFASQPVYVDVTGMSYSAWAPLVRAGLKTVNRLNIVYVEPGEYRRNPIANGPAEMFDLSDTTEGPAPLPGFSRLGLNDEAPFSFVALLGFEGARVLHFAETIELGDARVFPIAPAPGFRLEYPSHTVACNRQFIENTKSWSNLRFAGANDPFDLFRELQEVLDEAGQDNLRIALVGTKPHAIGAVLFAIVRPEKVELLYDHPVGKADRTIGVGQVIVYNLEEFFARNKGS